MEEYFFGHFGSWPKVPVHLLQQQQQRKWFRTVMQAGCPEQFCIGFIVVFVVAVGIHPEGVVVKVKEGLARALQKGYLLTSKECRTGRPPCSLLLFAVIFTHISAIFITTSWAVNCAPRYRMVH